MTALGDAVRKITGDGKPKPPGAPEYVQERLRRGQARLRELAPGRNECWQFFRGNTYVFRTQENALVVTPTRASVSGKGKQRWRARTHRPILTPFVRQEVSAATQRVPSYDVTPTNTDPGTVSAAKVAEKVALWGYDKWRIKDATEKVVTSAIVADEGFAWPYWDADTGPVVGLDDETGVRREGEICIRTYTANEVGWEPGVRFEDSRWYMIQQARPLAEVERLAGFPLSANGTDRQVIGTGKPTSNTKLVLVHEYLERPSPSSPSGRRLVIADEKVLGDPDDKYPLKDAKGNVVDEPVLLNLAVLKDPDSDRDHGLVKFCLDALRTYQDCVNKQIEFKNHLVPQAVTTPNNIRTPLTDEPNAVFEAMDPSRIVWRPTPQIPAALDSIMDRAVGDIARIFSQNAIPSQVESGKGIQALIEADQNARQAFLANLAEFHARLMHRCLALVQQFYTEPRDLLIVGEFGPDYMQGFLGADLMDQTQVRVLPRSLEVLTREAIEQKVMMLGGQLQWITPEEGLAAIRDGTLENLGSGYDYDRGRVWLIIEKIKAGPEVLFSMPRELKDVEVPVIDPATDQPAIDPLMGGPLTQTRTVEEAGWMPRPVDNLRVHKAEFAKWMKSADWLRLDAGQREAARLYWVELDKLEQQEMAKAQAQQNAAAETQGASNAAKPQFSPMPSLPNPAKGDPQSQG